MIGPEHVTFKTVDAEIENVHTGDDRRTMDVCEITYPDGKVTAFPVHDVSPEDGRKYSEIYAAKYASFKAGNPDTDQVARLEGEIAQRQNELADMRKSKDDRRITDDLGYGKLGDKANHQQAKAGQQTRDRHEKTAKHKAKA